MTKFPKKERLCSKRIINTLFEKGNHFYHFPFRIVWIMTPIPAIVSSQITVSVSKKRFRKAVIRNLLKRRIREAYRMNKQILFDYLKEKNLQIAFILIFECPKILKFQFINFEMIKLIPLFIENIKKHSTSS
jgi:ribonuclease P protein component